MALKCHLVEWAYNNENLGRDQWVLYLQRGWGWVDIDDSRYWHTVSSCVKRTSVFLKLLLIPKVNLVL